MRIKDVRQGLHTLLHTEGLDGLLHLYKRLEKRGRALLLCLLCAEAGLLILVNTWLRLERHGGQSIGSGLFDLNGGANRVRKKQSSAIIAVDVRRFGHVINKMRFSVHTGMAVHSIPMGQSRCLTKRS